LVDGYGFSTYAENRTASRFAHDIEERRDVGGSATSPSKGMGMLAVLH
jgi:hypothetical protein